MSDSKEGMVGQSEKPPSQIAVMKEALKSKTLMIRFVILIYNWITNAFVYYGLSLNSTSLSGNKYLNYALVCLIEIPGYTLAWVNCLFGKKYVGYSLIDLFHCRLQWIRLVEDGHWDFHCYSVQWRAWLVHLLMQVNNILSVELSLSLLEKCLINLFCFTNTYALKLMGKVIKNKILFFCVWYFRVFCVSLLTLVFFTDLIWAVVSLFLVGKLGITISFSVLYTYSAEMIPTVKKTFKGFCVRVS